MIECWCTGIRDCTRGHSLRLPHRRQVGGQDCHTSVRWFARTMYSLRHWFAMTRGVAGAQRLALPSREGGTRKARDGWWRGAGASLLSIANFQRFLLTPSRLRRATPPHTGRDLALVQFFTIQPGPEIVVPWQRLPSLAALDSPPVGRLKRPAGARLPHQFENWFAMTMYSLRRWFAMTWG